MKYQKNKNWTMFSEDNELFISKGADEIYYLDELNNEQSTIIYDAYINDSFDDLVNDPQYEEIIKKLEKAGVIYQKKYNTNNQKLNLYIKYYGKPSIKLKNEIFNIISRRKNIKIIDNMENCDLALFIRINVKLKELVDNYKNIDIPHLLIDLGYSNNISIGPLVYQDTACLGCYIGKITKNWGDPIVPIEPDVTNKSELIAAFVLERIDEFIMYGNCPDLINGVWSYNVKTNCSNYNKIYKLPWCPLCNKNEDNDKIDLPWIKEFNYE